MSFTPKDWQDAPSTASPIDAAALEDLETRVTDYADDLRSLGKFAQISAAASTWSAGTGARIPWNAEDVDSDAIVTLDGGDYGITFATTGLYLCDIALTPTTSVGTRGIIRFNTSSSSDATFIEAREWVGTGLINVGVTFTIRPAAATKHYWWMYQQASSGSTTVVMRLARLA